MTEGPVEHGSAGAPSPVEARAIVARALALLGGGDRTGALDVAEDLVRGRAESAEAWNDFGNVLQIADERDLALRAYVTAANLEPAYADAWYNVGVLMRRAGRADMAVECFARAVNLAPRFRKAYEALGVLLYGLGRTEHSAEVYARWLEWEPEHPVVRHMAAATGVLPAPGRADDAYVRSTFDGFAASFDTQLAKLGYRAPELVTAALGERVAFQSGRLDVLDAGCGTGLCGPLLRSTARCLVGVDLSAGMLSRALARGSYDELHEGELCAYMRQRPGAYDLVVAADVLCYFGDLAPAFEAAAGCLRPGGVLAFTVEALAADAPSGYRIDAHGRYAHAAAYLESALAAAGFVEPRVTPDTLRHERALPVAGWVVTAIRPAAQSAGYVVATQT